MILYSSTITAFLLGFSNPWWSDLLTTPFPFEVLLLGVSASIAWRDSLAWGATSRINVVDTGPEDVLLWLMRQNRRFTKVVTGMDTR